jgi:Fe-S-cluster containining protein
MTLAAGWLRAAAEPAIVQALEGIYADIAMEVRQRGPACWASGRCCSFEKAGHRLYVTGLEAAYTVTALRAAPSTPTGDIPLVQVRASPPTPESLDHATQAGSCPFLSANLCGAHAARPLGCRVYFCDRSAQQWQQDLSERMLARVREIHDRHQIVYRYGEWRAMLAEFVPA